MKNLFKYLALSLVSLFIIEAMFPFSVQADTGSASGEWRNINGRKYLFNSDGRCASTTGIDVSKWQGDIDWGKVAGDDIHFAIIRVGHGHGENWADAYADTNMDGCDENGIPYGVYFYSEATNEQEATLEVNNLLERLKGRNPQLGVFVDVEATDVYQKAGIDPYKDGDKIVKLADLMLSMIKKAGYVPGIYANTDYFDNVLYPASHFNSAIRWVARYYNYNSNHSDSNRIPVGDWDIWQYGSTGSVAGIDGNVDLDVKLTEPYNRDYNNIKTGVSYCVHVQDYGDQTEVKNGASAGTTGESKRLEAIRIHLTN